MTVNGTLTSRGDFLLAGGGLMGTGRINAPFTTNVLGTITGGTDTTIGTLTFGGNLVLSSGSNLFVNTGGNGVSDRIAVVAESSNAQGAATNGIATLGGRISLAPVTGSIIRFGDLYTVLTAQGGMTGTFQAPTALSAILQPVLIYNANSVQVRINANSYANVVNQASQVQRNYASLLDRNRAPGALSRIFDVLDLQNAATIQATLEALAPRAEELQNALGISALDTGSGLIRNRVLGLVPGNLGGSMAFYGRPVQVASLDRAMGNPAAAMSVMSDVAAQPMIAESELPDTMSGFLAVGYVEGSSRPLAGTLVAGPRDAFDGFFVSSGLEQRLGTVVFLVSRFPTPILTARPRSAVSRRTANSIRAPCTASSSWARLSMSTCSSVPVCFRHRRSGRMCWCRAIWSCARRKMHWRCSAKSASVRNPVKARSVSVPALRSAAA